MSSATLMPALLKTPLEIYDALAWSFPLARITILQTNPLHLELELTRSVSKVKLDHAVHEAEFLMCMQGLAQQLQFAKGNPNFQRQPLDASRFTTMEPLTDSKSWERAMSEEKHRIPLIENVPLTLWLVTSKQQKKDTRGPDSAFIWPAGSSVATRQALYVSIALISAIAFNRLGMSFPVALLLAGIVALMSAWLLLSTTAQRPHVSESSLKLDIPPRFSKTREGALRLLGIPEDRVSDPEFIKGQYQKIIDGLQPKVLQLAPIFAIQVAALIEDCHTAYKTLTE